MIGKKKKNTKYLPSNHERKKEGAKTTRNNDHPGDSTESIISFNNAVFHLISRLMEHHRINIHIYMTCVYTNSLQKCGKMFHESCDQE